MKRPAFRRTALLSNVNILSESVDISEMDASGFSMLDPGGNPRCEIIFPRPSKDDVEDYGLVLDKRGFVDENESDGYDDWRSSIEPTMNEIWPVFIHDISAEDAASLMAEHARNCTLVQIDGEDNWYYITLNGGGMDLSFDIAAAYLCCGAVPPIALYGRSWQHEIAYQPVMGRRLASAMRKAARFLRYRLADVRRDAAKVAQQAAAAAIEARVRKAA